jgi:hypothetical protein
MVDEIQLSGLKGMSSTLFSRKLSKVRESAIDSSFNIQSSRKNLSMLITKKMSFIIVPNMSILIVSSFHYLFYLAILINKVQKRA